MSRIKTFLIGRNHDCDLTLDDPGVSRKHAEVILTADGRYYLTDRNSTHGTFVRHKSNWRPIHQEFVNSTERIRFGRCEIAASRLECLRAVPAHKEHKGAHENAVRSNRKLDAIDPAKELQRNPETGEIIEKP